MLLCAVCIRWKFKPNDNYVAWASWCLKSTATWLLVRQFSRVNIKENIKNPITDPLWEEVTGNRWIPIKRASKEEEIVSMISARIIIPGNYRWSNRATWWRVVKVKVRGSGQSTRCGRWDAWLCLNPTLWISSFLMIWLCMESGHQQR